jgi:phage terminase small subunit
MAGVKGKSGGARPGAGRKPAPPQVAPLGSDDPLEFLRSAWMGKIAASPSQIRAAAAALPFVHQKLGEGGKKDGAADRAKKASAGKFAAAPAPLKLVGKG